MVRQYLRDCPGLHWTAWRGSIGPGSTLFGVWMRVFCCGDGVKECHVSCW